MEAVDVNGTGDYVGGLVGYNSEGSITNCCCTGLVHGNRYIGGLVGDNRGSVTDSHSACAVTGEGAVDWGLRNMDVDPGFVRLGYWVNEPLELIEGDYHLRSEGWHWDQEGKSWTYDYYMTSACVDAGNPDTPLGEELMAVPRAPDNEWAVNVRINMGAYGGTVQASLPPRGWALLSDFDNDGTVDSLDLSE